jgi:hypothetical protein
MSAAPHARAVAVLVMVAALLATGCRRREPPPRDPQEHLIPITSVDTAPWHVGVRGTVEESAPGSGIFLLEPGGWRARLPDELRVHGVPVVFSGRPQPEPPGWQPPGHPFMLTGIRRDRSELEELLDGVRDAGHEGTQPFMR